VHAGLLVEDTEAIRTITLNRPEVMNALTDDMRSGIAETVRQFDADPALRVLVITGAGKGFCSGADLCGAATAVDRPRQAPAPRFWWHLPLEQTNKPTICALNGAAAGGGIGLALSCDWIFAAETARLHPAFVGLGLSPDNGVTQKIVARTGYPRALRFFLEGVPLTATDALAAGLVDEVAAPERLGSLVSEFAATLAGKAPVSVQLTKRLLKEAAQHDRATSLILEEAAIGLARQTEDSVEGAAAFRERRSPVWKGY
jgi:enoyl-CoA hydratase/carnithine racemase